MKPPRHRKNEWDKPNSHGEYPGGLCCMRSTSGTCFEHDKNNFKPKPRKRKA